MVIWQIHIEAVATCLMISHKQQIYDEALAKIGLKFGPSLI